jgi:glucoamylase
MCSILTSFSQPGVLVSVFPEANQPEYNIFFVRDGAQAYNAWFMELLLSPNNQTIRALLDDYVHALVRTQHVVNIAGNSFSGGLDEPFFDVHIGVITNSALRIGSPAAGVFTLPHTIRTPLYNIDLTLQTGHHPALYT